MLAAVSPVETISGWLSKWFYFLLFWLFLPAAKTKETKTHYTLKPQKPLEVFGDAKTHFALSSIQLFNECFQYLMTVLPSTECSVSCRGEALNGLFRVFFRGEGEGLGTGWSGGWSLNRTFSGMRVGGWLVCLCVCVCVGVRERYHYTCKYQ